MKKISNISYGTKNINTILLHTFMLFFIFLFSCVYVCVYSLHICAHFFNCGNRRLTLEITFHHSSTWPIKAKSLHQIRSSPTWLASIASLFWDPLPPSSQAVTIHGPPHPPGIYVGADDPNCSHTDRLSTLTTDLSSLYASSHEYLVQILNSCASC